MRINPDVRINPYKDYPTRYEYNQTWKNNKSSGNGFHECVNFREFYINRKHVVAGYVPDSKKTKDLRANGGNPFVILTITNAKNRSEKHNQIIGIQAGCLNQGKCDKFGIAPIVGPIRNDIPSHLKDLKLRYNYVCPAEMSFLLQRPINNAIENIFGENKIWFQGFGPAIPIPHYAKGTSKSGLGGNVFKIIDILDKHIQKTESKSQIDRWENIKKWIIGHLDKQNCVDNSITENINLRELKKSLSKEDPNDKRSTRSTQHKRSNRMKKFALLRAKGKCELCGEWGPFEYKASLFLEGHHIIPLSRGGKNKIDNIAALCPNCHRKAHYTDIDQKSKIVKKLLVRVKKANKNIK